MPLYAAWCPWFEAAPSQLKSHFPRIWWFSTNRHLPFTSRIMNLPYAKVLPLIIIDSTITLLSSHKNLASGCFIEEWFIVHSPHLIHHHPKHKGNGRNCCLHQNQFCCTQFCNQTICYCSNRFSWNPLNWNEMIVGGFRNLNQTYTTKYLVFTYFIVD